MVGSQSYGVEMVRPVNHENSEGIVFFRIGKRDARRANWMRESEVENYVCIRALLRPANIGGAQVEHGVVVEHSPKETLGTSMVLSVIDGRRCCAISDSEKLLVLGVVGSDGAATGLRVHGWELNIDEVEA